MTTTRAESVADQIRRAVRAGEYVSGERLVELKLAQSLNVSQTTIRDALGILQQEGWVVKVARRGVYVRTFTPEQATELYALWAAIEGLIVGWAADVLTRQQINRLRGLFDQARIQTQTGELYAAYDSTLRLHDELGTIADRPQSTALLTSLRNQIFLLENLRQMRAPRGLRECKSRLEGYDLLLRQMESGQKAEAQQTIGQIIHADCESLLPLLK